MKLIITLVACSTLAFFGYQRVGTAEGASSGVKETSLHTVQRRDLRITVTENGYLKAENSLKMKPKFERQGRITWLVEEGKEVEEGDVLVEFDRSELEDQVSELKTSLIQYEMEHEAGVAELGIQERDNETMVEKAELALELAKLELERYESGSAPNERRKQVLAKEKADSEYERASERYEQVPELAKEGFLTAIQVEEERIRLREAEINKENAARELELFEKYTFKMELTKHQTAVKDAQRELDNAKIKAGINLKQKKAAVTQQQRKIDSTGTRIEQLNEEVGNMTMRAPQPGIVHYGDPGRPWMHDQVKIGNTLHKGNTIITLPDLSVMQVLLQVHEADIDLVEMDMPVVVTIETHKGLTFPAKVTEIAMVASSQSWEDQTNKTFRVEVTMDTTEIELRAGVTARAEIQVEVLEDVLQAPIHAVHAEGERHFCFVHRGGELVQRDVEVGKNNAHYVEVSSGLEEGDRVLLYDPRETDSVGSGESDAVEEGPSAPETLGASE